MRLAVLVLLAGSLAARAGEFAILSNGFRLPAERHERDGNRIRLFFRGGVTELDAASVAGFEREEEVPAASAVTVPPAEPADPKRIVNQAAERWRIDPKLVHSVAQVESGYRPDAVSPKGAVGLMQLMPATARGLGADPLDPQQNADAGARYLRELLLKYQDDPYQLRLALAAYNAGPGAVDRYKGIPPYRETMEYVEKVLRQYSKK